MGSLGRFHVAHVSQGYETFLEILIDGFLVVNNFLEKLYTINQLTGATPLSSSRPTLHHKLILVYPSTLKN